MSEWLKEHAWKACVRETVPRVRIPFSPPFRSPSASLNGDSKCLQWRNEGFAFVSGIESLSLRQTINNEERIKKNETVSFVLRSSLFVLESTLSGGVSRDHSDDFSTAVRGRLDAKFAAHCTE